MNTPNPNPSPELLPCPFCGGNEGVADDHGRVRQEAHVRGWKHGLEDAAKACLEVSGLIGAANGSSVDSALLEAARRIRLLSQGGGK